MTLCHLLAAFSLLHHLGELINGSPRLLDGTTRPVMTDDTCYFLSFTQYEMAYVTMLLLNSPQVQTFYGSIALKEAKRPLCKKVLARLDLLQAAAAHTTLAALQETKLKLHLPPRISASVWNQWAAEISKAAQL